MMNNLSFPYSTEILTNMYLKSLNQNLFDIIVNSQKKKKKKTCSNLNDPIPSIYIYFIYLFFDLTLKGTPRPNF